VVVGAGSIFCPSPPEKQEAVDPQGSAAFSFAEACRVGHKGGSQWLANISSHLGMERYLISGDVCRMIYAH
jgi:hypothetical protein